jgi:hypothetical protein
MGFERRYESAEELMPAAWNTRGRVMENDATEGICGGIVLN